MDFADRIRALSQTARSRREHLQTEEATKNALVMPFLNALGYNVFDPTQVVPEFTADHGIKKGEKVDYAVMRDGEPIILIECKASNIQLAGAHASQLFRYFSVTPARFALLTNGLEFRFYSDLDAPNRMDQRPFLVLDLIDVDEAVLPELKKLTSDAFDPDKVLASAGELKHLQAIKRLLEAEFDEPSEGLVRFVVGQIHSGRFTAKVRQQFEPILKRGMRQFLADRVDARLKSALDQADDEPDDTTAELDDGEVIVTTEEELEGFHLVKAILRRIVAPERVVARDVRSYFGVLLDNNNRKPLCRLHFNAAQKHLGLFDNPDKREDRVAIRSIDDIYNYADRLRATPGFYEVSTSDVAQVAATDSEVSADTEPRLDTSQTNDPTAR